MCIRDSRRGGPGPAKLYHDRLLHLEREGRDGCPQRHSATAVSRPFLPQISPIFRHFSPVLSVSAPGSRTAQRNGGKTAENGRETAEKQWAGWRWDTGGSGGIGSCHLSINYRSAVQSLLGRFQPLRNGPRSFGATFWNPGVKTEKTAKKREKTGQKWARYGLRKRVRAAVL